MQLRGIGISGCNLGVSKGVFLVRSLRNVCGVFMWQSLSMCQRKVQGIYTHTHIYTADCKIAETFSTVCNDFLVVNSCKNPWDSIGPVPIILQSAEYICMYVYIYIYIYICIVHTEE